MRVSNIYNINEKITNLLNMVKKDKLTVKIETTEKNFQISYKNQPER